MTGLYVDSSAILKRIFIAPESPRVRAILRDRVAAGALVASSELAWVEVARAILRAGVRGTEPVEAAFSGIAQLPLSSTALTRARAVGAPNLRSLDAIHLAAAIELGAVEMLTFDRRLADAAGMVGVKVIG